jgi:hypothetical protein
MLSPWIKLHTRAHKFPIRQESNYKYCVDTMLLFYNLHKNYLIQTEISTSIHSFIVLLLLPSQKTTMLALFMEGNSQWQPLLLKSVCLPFDLYVMDLQENQRVFWDRHKMTNIKKRQYDHGPLHFTVTEPYVTHYVATKCRIGQMERNWYPWKKYDFYAIYDNR